MKQYLDILVNTPLFHGVEPQELNAMLACLGARKRCVAKGSCVLRQGEPTDDILVVVEGTLHIQNDDYWGNRCILGQVVAGEMVAEAYIAREPIALLNDVTAVEDSVVIAFDVKRLMTTCSSACRFHTMVVHNLVFALAEKNRRLVQKLGHMSKRTTREKLLSYLSEEAKRRHASSFSIPFNRQQLADYLAVDRSAMSAELGKLRDEGLLEFRKHHFTLL